MTAWKKYLHTQKQWHKIHWTWFCFPYSVFQRITFWSGIFVSSSLKNGNIILNGYRKSYTIVGLLLLKNLFFIQWKVILYNYQFYCRYVTASEESDILFKANIWDYINSRVRKSKTCQTIMTNTGKSPAFPKFMFPPLCFHKRPTLVIVFTSWKKFREEVCFYEKKRQK